MNLYTVNEAIWLAAASYAYAQFKIKDKVCVTDFYMKAAELANNAKTFTTNDVQLARIHQHCNGDHANCSNKFLRRIEETAGNPVFRVTATGEFGGDKERPDGMDPASELEIEGLTFTIGDLISFVEGDYKQIVSGQALYKLYTIEEIRNRLVEIGFNIRNVASDMVQIGDKRTTIHRTADRGIILYATEEDFENITEDIGLKENIYVSNARSKEMIQDLLDKEQGNIEKVLCFPDGNRILHPSSAANYNADEIIMYSAGNFRKVFKILTGYEFMGNKTDIDYLGILEYLKNNRELPYAKPERPELTDEQRDKFLEIKKNGQEIVAELKKIYERCKEEYGLEKCEKVAWDDASHTKTRKYLWVPMKYDKYGDRRESISVFVEMLAADKAVFRVSLEFKNDSAKADEYQAYHRHLELPIDEEAGLVYVAGSNELGRPERLSETQDVVKEKVESKEYDKVQICKYIDTDKYPTNEDIEEGILETVEALLPYYEYVIGAGEGKRAWLLTWNPDNWNWEDYEEACVSTKHGEITIIPWTCKNKQPQVNDDVFLIKTGVQPRGIIAHGRVSKEHYEAPHYDEEKAAAGVMAGHIDAEYDWIQHYENEEILLQDDLKELFPEQQWSPMGSGIEIRSEYVTDLKKMWNALIEKKEVQGGMGSTKEVNEYDKNMILYGPPGTGKTYSTAKYAVAICDGDKTPDLNDYPAVMKRYRQLMSEHRIAFVTFHQSYGYEEFIEGIKPVMDKNRTQVADGDSDKSGDIKYDIIDGVFKGFCDRARTSTVITKSKEGLISDSARVWKATVRVEARQDCFDNDRIRIDWGFDSDGAAGFVEDIQKGDIIITTDGSRTVINGIAVAVTDDAEDLHADGDSTSRQVVWLVKDINENIKSINKNKMLHRKTVARVPNMAAADIISLAKKVNPKDDVLSQTTIEENKKPYVFVIDEINRGNISKIFGELITLIEDTKREGLDECIPATLPYSGEEFTVPDNVYLLGTMNTADRSIALMDTALRRRFKFKEMLPDHKLLKGVTIEDEDEVLNVEIMLKIINDRITYLYDREHTIGHAIFMKLKKPGENTMANLASIFSKSVIPLLQEYFYEDYEKIRLVLGDNAKKETTTQFVIAEDVPEDTFEGDVSDEIDIPEKSYRIEYDNFDNIMAYKGISKKL